MSGERLAWGCAFYAGLRRGELRALLWNDVDLAVGVIRVERSMNSYGDGGEPKSRAGRRSVPIVAALRDLLVVHKLAARRDAGLVFLDLYGHLMPGNEDEAVALVDAYLDRADTRNRLRQLNSA